MRENFICAHFATSWHCKIGSKARFFSATPPHLFRSKISLFPAFPRFEPDFGRFFEESHSFFPRSTVYFLSHSPILNPISGDFLMARHSFHPLNSLFPCFILYFPTLRALLREISPFIIATLLFSHSVKAFSFRASLTLHALPHLYLPIYFPSAPQSLHPLHYSPTFFLFPPHFSIPLPI